jgi:hypothetical protein
LTGGGKSCKSISGLATLTRERGVFFLKLEGRDLERLLKLAADKKGTPVERLARLAFLKGLRLLAKADAETIATEVSPEKRPYKLRKPLEEIQAYIRANWEQQTDEQMGEALGYGFSHIRQWCPRGSFGLRLWHPVGAQATQQ